MPYDITLPRLPAGYAARSKRKGETTAIVSHSGFYSSEDGEDLITHLEGFPSEVMALVSPQTIFMFPLVDHMLVIIRRDRTAKVYLNEISFHTLVQTKRGFKKGAPVFCDDIADVVKMRLFHGQDRVVIPEDAGVVLVFSHRWRRAIYYDFLPLSPKDRLPRPYDIEVVFGHCFAKLAFQSRLSMSENDWETFLEQKWFPFIGIRQKTLNHLLEYARNDGSLDELLDDVATELSQRLESELAKWERHAVIKSHFNLLKRAAERYLDEDYMSAASILYPRIEGILRGYRVIAPSKNPLTQNGLVEAAIAQNPNVQHSHSLLVPAKFASYLRDFFFQDFDPNDPQGLSRNTVAHGVAPEVDFNKKGATLAFLILEQLSFYVVPPRADEEDTTGEARAENSANSTDTQDNAEGDAEK